MQKMNRTQTLDSKLYFFVIHTQLLGLIRTVFAEDLNCDLDVRSVAFSGNKGLLACVLPKDTKEINYFLRILDLTQSPSAYTDVTLSKEPIQLLVANLIWTVLPWNCFPTKTDWTAVFFP